ncbi:MAG TPA: selenocysteine-specific translation elongation factor [Janthinobacterium sp.]|nr:selenocysteine-specific translation elongation factor [Janthinobacterium sp.]
MIVGTAGHIDHGKTTLTRALTGVDTDRLKEEKARGISIELGYAYVPLEDGRILGVIDVPGHEKFIRTMAAGVTGIDFALLVVAADDGIMPQTLEHLAILRLLGIRRGAVALTKSDRADAARLDQVEAEVRTLLAHTDFAAAAIFRTSAGVPGDAGVAALLRHLTAQAQALPARDERRLFRLGIDRVFTLSGQGTIVAGTALAGRVAAGDTLQLAPGGELLRVRSIHAQNRPAEAGLAGQRLALNLSSVARDSIARGSWIVAPALGECSERFDAELSLLADAGAALKPWAPLHVHLGAAHRVAHLVLLEGEVLAPGQRGRVQLVFDEPLHAVPGDRFVVRNAQATLTIGGGMVLDPFAPARKRRSAARHAWLDALADFIAGGEYAALLAQSPLGLRLSTLVRLALLPPERIALPADALRIPLRGDDALLISGAALRLLEERILAALAAFHERAPDEAGPELWRLKRIVEAGMEDLLWTRLIAGLMQAGALLQLGRSLHLPSHTVELRPEEQALAQRLLASLDQGGFDPPWVRDLGREHQVPEAEVRSLLRKLAKSGQISQVVPDLFYHPAQLARLAQLVGAAPVGAAAFRDASGLGRKRAIQVLEFFDRVGYTRRVGNAHLLRPNAEWSYGVA